MTDACNVLFRNAFTFNFLARQAHWKSDTLYEDAMIAAAAAVNKITVATQNAADCWALASR